MPNEASLRCIVCNETKKESTVSFFRIPYDPKRSLEWLRSVSRMDLAGKSPIQLRNCRICANHFSDQCFNSDLKHRLTRNAVPTLGKPPKSYKVPRLEEYSLTLNNKIINAFLDERTNVTNSMKETNGWNDCHTSDAIVPFTTHNGGSASHSTLHGSSKTSLPTTVSDTCNDSETEDSNSLTTKSHQSPEPFAASLFCEVSYGADNETEVTNNSLWKNSTFSEIQPNQENENSFSVPVMCSVSSSLDSKSEVCYNIRQRNCMITGASPNEEAGKPFPVSLFSTVENDENSRLREQPTLIPENGTPFPISLYQTTSNNLDSETEANDVTDERNSSIPPCNRKRKRAVANSLLTQYITFLKQRDIAKQKRHEEKMAELRKNNELLAKVLMAIEKE